MKKTLVFLPFIIIYGMQAIGQDFEEHIKVQRSFESQSADFSKPALFSITIPRDSSASYLFNGGISIDLWKPLDMFSVFGVYNRNTLIDIKQNNYKLGLALNNFYFLPWTNPLSIFGNTTGQFMRNIIDTSSSLIFTSYWHPVFKIPDVISIGGYTPSEHSIESFFLPQIGLEYQNVFLSNAKASNGYDVRFYFDLELHMKWRKPIKYSDDDLKAKRNAFSQFIIDTISLDTTHWKNISIGRIKEYTDSTVNELMKKVVQRKHWNQIMELVLSYTGRSAFINHNADFDSYIPLFTAGLNFYPFAKDNFSFGISYNDGANPIDGTLKQTFWLFSINFKFPASD
jgi:hypothetical protein